MDSLIIGVMLAAFKYYYKDIYEKFANRTKLLMCVVFIGYILFFIYFIEGQEGLMFDKMFIARTFLFTFVSIFCAIFIAALEKSRYLNNVLDKKRVSRLFGFTSKTSYVIYLIHLEVYSYFMKYNKYDSVANSAILLIVSLIITFVLSYLIHKFYENPIMNLRNKIRIFNVDKSHRYASLSNNKIDV